MTPKPEISVILPVYNGKTHIEKTIHTIINQSYQNWELIVLDDGSTDNSFEILKKVSLLSDKIHLYRHEPNKGLAFTLNRLLQYSMGKYIAIQEQDDFSIPDRLEKQHSFLEDFPKIDMVSGIAEWLNDDGKVSNQFPGILVQGGQFPQDTRSMVKFLFVQQSKIVNAACMFRRSIVDKMWMPFDEQAKMSIDWQFFLRIAHNHRIWGLPDVLVSMNRGQHHAHLTKNKELQFYEARRCIRKIYHEYKDNPESPINYPLYRQAMSYELNLEGRYYGGLNGLGRILNAIIYDPANKNAWRSLIQLLSRGVRKLF